MLLNITFYFHFKNSKNNGFLSKAFIVQTHCNYVSPKTHAFILKTHTMHILSLKSHCSCRNSIVPHMSHLRENTKINIKSTNTKTV